MLKVLVSNEIKYANCDVSNFKILIFFLVLIIANFNSFFSVINAKEFEIIMQNRAVFLYGIVKLFEIVITAFYKIVRLNRVCSTDAYER